MIQTKISEHAEASLLLLDEAERHLDNDDLYKACEKGLEAVNSYLATVAKQRGWAHESKRDLHDIEVDLALETDDPREIISLTMAIGGGLTIKFYGESHTDWMVEGSLKDVRMWISLMESRSKPPPDIRESQLSRKREAIQRLEMKKKLEKMRERDRKDGRSLMERYLDRFNDR